MHINFKTEQSVRSHSSDVQACGPGMADHVGGGGNDCGLNRTQCVPGGTPSVDAHRSSSCRNLQVTFLHLPHYIICKSPWTVSAAAESSVVMLPVGIPGTSPS